MSKTTGPAGGSTGTAEETSVLLVNMGGPAERTEVQPYLEAIFRDPAILPLPSPARRPLAWWIARRRAPKVADRYAVIGGGSPLGRWTEGQAAALERALVAQGRALRVAHAFRYTKPSIPEAMAEAAERSRRILLVPLFPHYTGAMTGSVLTLATACAAAEQVELESVRSFADEPEVLACWGEMLGQALVSAGPEARVLFVAHGIPERSVRRGEDYPDRVADTARRLGERLPGNCPWTLAFQSRVGPVRWTRPYLDDELARLCESRAPIVVMPLSFVADCLETLYDLDIVARARAREAGVDSFVRVGAFNDDERFASALAAIVLRQLARPPLSS